MTKIYCLTAWASQGKLLGSKLFMSIDGIVKYLIKQSPIDNKYYVTGSGAFDITAHNIGNTLNDRIKQGMVFKLFIKQNFVFIIKAEYTISIIMAED